MCSIFDIFLVNHLRNRYIETRYIPEGKEWPPNQPKYYVNLAVVHYQGSRTQEEVIFGAQYHRHIDLVTNREEVPHLISSTTRHSKITKDIISLFTDDPHINNAEANAINSISLPKSILIEGAPGIGKTILLKEIAYRWANGTILDNARIVFLIYLRDSRFQSVTTINELLHYFDCLEEKEVPAVVKRLKQSGGEGMVFLIDGLDEYPGALQNTFLTCLIDRKILSKSMLVITSRPCASVSLHNKVERRIEILGFGSDERDEYISRFLQSSPEKRRLLEMYLKQHPMLNSLVYIPFHLTVLLFLLQQGNLPETLTEMNEFFILHTVYRHMEKHDLPTSCVVKLDNFPKNVHHMVYKLSKLAFQGLEKNQLVFTFDEVKQVCPEVDTTPGALNGFGLLQAVQHYPIKGVGKTFSFNFLHLSMQEFLAAWYISHCPVEQQVQLLKQSFMKRRHWDELDNSNARMWQMYVGIVGVDCDAWVQFTNQYTICLDTFDDPLQYLYYFQYLLEGKGKDVQLISPIFRGNAIQFPSRILLPYHIALLCSYLSKSTRQWQNYNFCGNDMGDIGVKVLSNFLLGNEKVLTCIGVFDLSSNFLTSQSSIFISSIIQRGTLGILNLSCNDLGDSGIAEVSQALKVNTTIKSLFLSLNNIGIDGAKTLAIALCLNHTLKCLVISYNKIMDDGVMAISECFKISGENNTKLTCVKILDLSTNCLTSHSRTAVRTIIQEGALVYLGLSYNKLGVSGAYEISKALQGNLTIKQLFLSDNHIGVEGAISIAVALCDNQTLEELDISINQILDEGTIAIAECLKTNRTLKCLSITHNSITEIGAVEIAEVFKFNPVIEKLKIEEKFTELLKPSNEQLLYNETVDKCYHIATDSSHHYQETALIRVWSNKFC